MLVLTRGISQGIHIGDNVRIVICRIAGDKVRVGIEAPNGIRIWRDELVPIVESEGVHKVLEARAA